MQGIFNCVNFNAQFYIKLVNFYTPIWNQSFPSKGELGEGKMHDLMSQKGLFSWNMEAFNQSHNKEVI